MIKFGGKEYRNLPEQVAQNANDIEELKKNGHVYNATNGVQMNDGVLSADLEYLNNNLNFTKIYSHSLTFELKEVDTEDTRRTFTVLAISNSNTKIETSTALKDFLSKRINIPMYDAYYDIMGYLYGIDDLDNITVYCGDGNGALTGVDFVTTNTITDVVNQL